MFPDNTERTSNMLLAILHKVRHRKGSAIRCERAADRPDRKFRFEHETDRVMTSGSLWPVLVAIALTFGLPAAGQIGGRATRPQIQRPDGPVAGHTQELYCLSRYRRLRVLCAGQSGMAVADRVEAQIGRSGSFRRRPEYSAGLAGE